MRKMRLGEVLSVLPKSVMLKNDTSGLFHVRTKDDMRAKESRIRHPTIYLFGIRIILKNQIQEKL